jgi:hypothetical protein
MKLSEHFSLQEMTKSQTAVRMGIDNAPDDEQLQCLTDLCRNVLDHVRSEFGPLTPSSGFRSVALCEAIGSKPTSQHAKGEAADFEVMGVDNMELAKWIAHNLVFDQLILEYYKEDEPNSGWVHCSYTADGNRNEVLKFDGKTYTRGVL